MAQPDGPPELAERHLLLRFLDRVSVQAALIAGFAFAALAEVLSTALPLPYWRGMFFSITATLSICLELLVLFFYLQFALVKDGDLRHYAVEVVAFNWINLAGLFFFGLSLVGLAWIYLKAPTMYIVTAIVALSLI